METKLKHLEFLQNVITRMNGNSFMIKGWTVTLVSALFALAAKDANINYTLIAYFAILVFWILDGFFISTEKKFRNMYDSALGTEASIANMKMTPDRPVNGWSYDCLWIGGIFSKTLAFFYVPMILIAFGVYCLFSK